MDNNYIEKKCLCCKYGGKKPLSTNYGGFPTGSFVNLNSVVPTSTLKVGIPFSDNLYSEQIIHYNNSENFTFRANGFYLLNLGGTIFSTNIQTPTAVNIWATINDVVVPHTNRKITYETAGNYEEFDLSLILPFRKNDQLEFYFNVEDATSDIGLYTIAAGPENPVTPSSFLQITYARPLRGLNLNHFI